MNALENDEKYMRECLLLAEEAARELEAPIGAVVVQNGQIIGRGRNRREGDSNALGHAEILAIEDACKFVGNWRLCGCELYVTLEPCPMCAGAAINSRVERVIYGASDPKAGSLGTLLNLFDYPYNHKPKVTSGILAEECGKVLTDFFKQLRQDKDKK